MKLRNGGGEKEATSEDLNEGHNSHTQRWNRIGNETYKIAQLAKERPKEQFTSLIHLLNEENLSMCHRELNGNKAVGVDEVTKAKYEESWVTIDTMVLPTMAPCCRDIGIAQ